MSAYMVDREHIAYLVQAARHRRILGHSDSLHWYCKDNLYVLDGGPHTTQRTSEDVAQMLWDENLASINCRYPDTIDDPSNLPGKIGETYVYGAHVDLPFETFEPPQVIKACHCLDYQSCEHPGWVTSEAKTFVDALESAAVQVITGYGEAVWGAPPIVTTSTARA